MPVVSSDIIHAGAQLKPTPPIYSPSLSQRILIFLYKGLPSRSGDVFIPSLNEGFATFFIHLIRQKCRNRARTFVTRGLDSMPQSVHTEAWRWAFWERWLLHCVLAIFLLH